MTAQTDTKKLVSEIERRVWSINWVLGTLLPWLEYEDLKGQLRLVKTALIDIQDLVESGDLEVQDMRLLEAKKP